MWTFKKILKEFRRSLRGLQVKYCFKYCFLNFIVITQLPLSLIYIFFYFYFYIGNMLLRPLIVLVWKNVGKERRYRIGREIFFLW